MPPDAVGRIQLMCMRREEFHNQITCLGRILVNVFAFMNRDSIPEYCHGASERRAKCPEELDDRVALVIEIIGQKGILEANLASRGMDCDCTNGRDPPMRIRDAMDRGLPPRCIGAPDDRLKHKTCFVDKDEVGFPCPRRVSDAGKRFLYPPPDSGVISI